MTLVSRIPRGIKLQGEVRGDGDLVVSGEVIGPIDIAGSLVIEGTVTGEVRAEHVVVRGTLEGDVQASQSMRLDARARLLGNAQAGRITIAQGAFVRGRITMTGNTQTWQQESTQQTPSAKHERSDLTQGVAQEPSRVRSTEHSLRSREPSRPPLSAQRPSEPPRTANPRVRDEGRDRGERRQRDWSDEATRPLRSPTSQRPPNSLVPESRAPDSLTPPVSQERSVQTFSQPEPALVPQAQSPKPLVQETPPAQFGPPRNPNREPSRTESPDMDFKMPAVGKHRAKRRDGTGDE